jgi:hypothetical protein
MTRTRQMVRRSSSEKSDEGVQTRQEEEIIVVKRTGGKAKPGCFERFIYWVGDGENWVGDNDPSAWDYIKRKYRN